MTRTWILGQFANPEALVGAARKLRELGHTELDTYSPYPVEGIEDAIGLRRSRVPLICLIGGLTGASGGFLMQWYLNAVNWPINVGGRPPFAAPSFIPVTFELGVLLGSFAAFFGLFAILGLPRPHHPVFEVEAFRSASQDGFWLSVCSRAAEQKGAIESALGELGASNVASVEDAE